jgi:hypothetical protein
MFLANQEMRRLRADVVPTAGFTPGTVLKET